MVQEDEIDISQIALSLWAQKIWIGIILSVSLVFAIYYASALPNKFKATAVFSIQNPQQATNFSASEAGFAALAGLSLGALQSGNNNLFDRWEGRDFALILDQKVNLKSDPFFNPKRSHTPNTTTQVKNFIKSLIVGNSNQTSVILSEDERISENIFKNYLNNITFSETKHGSIKIVVEHINPVRAAIIANALVAQISDEIEYDERASNKAQLSYLSGELAKANQDLIDSQTVISNFAISNGLSSPSVFIQRSQMMADMRNKLQNTREMQLAIEALIKIVSRPETPSTRLDRQLRTKFPVIDKIEFRRLLGLPEAVNAWVTPSLRKLQNLSKVLNERAARFELNLTQMRVEAENNATLADQLIGLKRNEGAAEATFQVMMEQVKAFSLKSGFLSKRVKILQSATPSSMPFEPNRKMIIGIGLLIGLFIASSIFFIINIRKGLLFSQNLINRALSMPRSLEFKPRSRFGKSIPNIVQKIKASGTNEFLELDFDIRKHPNKIVLVSPMGSSINAMPFALTLVQIDSQFENVTKEPCSAMILLGRHELQGLDLQSSENGKFKKGVLGGTTFYAPESNTSTTAFLSKPFFSDFINNNVLPENSRIIVVTSSDVTAITAAALIEYDPITVAVTRPGKTTRQALCDATQNIRWFFNVSISN